MMKLYVITFSHIVKRQISARSSSDLNQVRNISFGRLNPFALATGSSEPPHPKPKMSGAHQRSERGRTCVLVCGGGGGRVLFVDRLEQLLVILHGGV